MNKSLCDAVKLAIAVTAFLVAACSTPTTRPTTASSAAIEAERFKQQEIALETKFKNELRLLNVAQPLLVASTDLCGNKVRPQAGIRAANIHAFDKDLHDALYRIYGMDETLQVTNIARASPADKAGLQVGDQLVAVNGESVPNGREVTPEGKKALKKFAKSLAKILESGNPIDVEIIRDGTPMTVTVVPEIRPDIGIFLAAGDEVNAYADGRNVYITKGMLRFVDDDTELGFVVAHEISHDCMKHIESKVKNSLWGTLLDVAAAAYGVNTQGAFGNMTGQLFSQAFEAEADYVGLYIMARADANIEDAPYFWRRMAAEHPGSIKQNHAASHPATPERFASLEAAVVEIRTKEDAGLPLVPTSKKQDDD